MVHSGIVVAFARVSVTAEPSDVEDNSRIVPVADADLLAGNLPDGEIKEVREVSAQGDNVLPPGEYALLLGSDLVPGRYYLANGLYGSFEVDGESAYQRCYFDGVGAAEVAKSGQTNLETLTTMFADAIAKDMDNQPSDPAQSK